MHSLRSHHLLCIQLYRGLGYDQNFCSRMQHIIDELNTSPHDLIKLVSAGDDLCGACPHFIDGICHNGCAHVDAMDQKVAQYLALPEQVSYAAILNAIKTRIDEMAFNDCCSDCSWFHKGICSYASLKSVLAQKSPH